MDPYVIDPSGNRDGLFPLSILAFLALGVWAAMFGKWGSDPRANAARRFKAGCSVILFTPIAFGLVVKGVSDMSQSFWALESAGQNLVLRRPFPFRAISLAPDDVGALRIAGEISYTTIKHREPLRSELAWLVVASRDGSEYRASGLPALDAGPWLLRATGRQVEWFRRGSDGSLLPSNEREIRKMLGW